MKLDKFNELDTNGKFTYLIDCLNIRYKNKDESWNDYEKRLLQWGEDSDFDLPEAHCMKYMLYLIKKYNNSSDDKVILLKNDHLNVNLLLNEYIKYERDSKLEKLV